MPTLKRPGDPLAPVKLAQFLLKPKHKISSLDDSIRILKVAADTKDLKLGKIIHAQLIISNQTSTDTDITRTNSLISLYVKCDQVSIARQLFDRMRKRNVVSWSALMAGYLHNDHALEVLGLFKSMVVVDNICPNEYILTTVLSSCSDSGRVEEGKQCHGFVLKSGMVFHQYVKNALVHMYSRCLEIEGAMHVLNMIPGYDIVSYNSVVNGLLENGHLKEAIEVLSMMVDDHVTWDSITYVTIFGLCARLKNLRLGLEVHGRMLKTEVECNAYVSSAIIDMYGKCGRIINAMKMFGCFQTRNVVSWTTVMDAYFQNGYFEEALNLFSKMRLEGVMPNEYTFAILLNSSACLSALRHGDLLHASAEKSGLKNHIIVGNALINMYTKSGNIEAANKVFTNMIKRNCITWNAMISGYSHHGLGKEALNVFQDMLAVGECPDHVTFVGVLSACAHLGLVQQGFYYLNHLMKQIGIEPGVEHYTCIVKLLSRAGQLDEAENYMRSVPVKWDVVAWRTLLNASHVHRKYSLGRRIAEIVVAMDPNDVGTYILLSNMYAKERRWDGVVKMRKLMRDRNIKKEPGVSWVEIRNTTHVFISEDSLHPESSQICKKVGELLAMIKPLGYVPDIAAVLHDVEDEQKEDYLSYHSEKLAIAYSLMKTPCEAPIRVIKNLRMCDDCHSAAKLIAKATNRMIIIRDANRFHHFKDGCCSCTDYW
ncbi:pentatricopeptide repeat-containing protein At5g39680 [Ziziphus jujuba]|uniref:Pentatricopeptide repeat-containing protein At5g39680 n=1 Tax=Ziziphus jujuba TaxID=326968 RepID=A0A6P4A0M7_ZIZJJ|nr:pentatricopeptide repeat-containing protein At5g39680 [Ziziphus jujuba]